MKTVYLLLIAKEDSCHLRIFGCHLPPFQCNSKNIYRAYRNSETELDKHIVLLGCENTIYFSKIQNCYTKQISEIKTLTLFILVNNCKTKIQWLTFLCRTIYLKITATQSYKTTMTICMLNNSWETRYALNATTHSF